MEDFIKRLLAWSQTRVGHINHSDLCDWVDRNRKPKTGHCDPSNSSELLETVRNCADVIVMAAPEPTGLSTNTRHKIVITGPTCLIKKLLEIL